MITENFIPYIKFESWALNLLFCFPFVWDETKGQLKVRDPWSRKLCRRIHIIYFTLTLFAMASVLYQLSKNGCHAKSMEGLMLFLATVQAFGWSTTWSPDKEALALFNATLDFDRKTEGGLLNYGNLVIIFSFF